MTRLKSIQDSVVGAHRLGYSDLDDEYSIELRIRQMLARALHTRSVVAYVGSGMSQNYNYPSWMGLFEMIHERTTKHLKAHRRVLSSRSQEFFNILKSKETDSARIGKNEIGVAFLSSCAADLEAAVKSESLDATGKRAMTLHQLTRKEWGEIQRDEKTKEKLEQEHSPLQVLIEELEISHFFTFNYDPLIELVWNKAHRPGNLLGPGAQPSQSELKVVTVKDLGPEAAVAFACRAGSTGSIFYGHGRAKTKDDLLVMGDRDYQIRYNGNGPNDIAYREGFELMHQAGALLFVGIGLAEQDLIRPMRTLLASRDSSDERPFFAILDAKGDAEAQRAVRIYFKQAYGVHVLHYDPTDGDHAKALCDTFRQLKTDRRKWFDAWQRIPAARTPRYALSPQDHRLMQKACKQPRQTWGKDLILPDHPITLVLQRAAGHGCQRVAHLAAEHSLSTHHGKVFVANLYLSMDLLTVLEAAGEHIAGKERNRDKQAPLDHLFSALRDGPHTLILTGLDRLMQPESSRASSEQALSNVKLADEVSLDNAWSPLGHASGGVEDRIFDRLLQECKREGFQGRVVLVSSMIPTRLSAAVRALEPHQWGEAGNIALLRVPTASSELWIDGMVGLCRSDDFRYQLHRAHRLLRGHPTPLKQLGAWLGSLPPGQHLTQLSELNSRIGATHITQRSMRVLRFILSDLRSTSIAKGEGKIATREGDNMLLLQNLAHFTAPCSPHVLGTLLNSRRAEQVEESQILEALVKLEDQGLCYETTCELGGRTFAPVHGVRQWLGESLRGYTGQPWSGVPQKFSLPGFTRDPDYERLLSKEALKGLFHKVEQLTKRAGQFYEQNETTSARIHFRAAYDLVRSQLGLSAIRRGTDEQPLYPRYHILLLGLVNLLQDSHKQHSWLDYQTTKPFDKHETQVWSEAWLYAGELVWLFNELALIPFTEGQISDTIPQFRKVFRTQKLVDGRRKSWRWAREQMFEGALLIDLAKLGRAHYVLMEARSVAHKDAVGGPDLQSRCDGYLGLVLYLMGDYQQARQRLTRSIEDLRLKRNFRALSIAFRLRGNLRRHLNELEDSDRDFKDAIIAAERGRHPDLIMAAKLSQIHLWIKRQHAPGRVHALKELSSSLSEKQKELNSVERYSRSIGSRRLEVEGNIARISLQRMGGDLEHAWAISRKTLALTRSHGMQLAFIRMLALAGQISRERGNASNSLLDAATSRAKRAGFVHVLERLHPVDPNTH